MLSNNVTYKFPAGPAGLYPYHCHVEPVQDHINRGLYGAMIIDPKEPRTHAHEMMMLMNGYDLGLNKEMVPTARIPIAAEANAIMYPPPPAEEGGEESIGEDSTRPELELDRDNEVYTVNGKAFQYMNHPIKIKLNEPQRIYLVNMVEFDPVNSFHLHAGMFNYTASGTMETPPTVTDIVTLGQGDRGMIEFTPKHLGQMMIHAHINEFTSLGWMGTMEVVP
jgi:FtsP/CotA-like multicopper oxidase with cupredoxin domain